MSKPISMNKDYAIFRNTEEDKHEAICFSSKKTFKADLLVSHKDGFIVFKDKNGLYGILNSSLSEITHERFNSIENVYTNNRNNRNLFKDNLCAVVKNSKIGFINSFGKLIVPARFDVEKSLKILHSRIIFEKNNLFGVLDLNQNELIPFEYLSILSCSNNYFIAVNQQHELVLLNSHGKIIKKDNSEKYKRVESFDGPFCFAVNDKEKAGTFDFNLKKLHPCKFSSDQFAPANKKRYWFRRNKLFALFNEKGKQLSKYAFVAVNPIVNGSAIVKINSEEGYLFSALLSKNGKLLTDWHYGAIYELGENKSVVAEKSKWVKVGNQWGVGGKLIILTRSGEEIDIDGIGLSFFDDMNIISGGVNAIIQGNNTCYIIDYKGNIIINKGFKEVSNLNKIGALVKTKNSENWSALIFKD